jgi:hypothetical protein
VHELLRWLLGCIGRAPVARQPQADADAVDQRLNAVDQKLRNIAARLRLLERQSDPRDWHRHG